MNSVIKKFLEWVGLKEKLHAQAHHPPLFKEGEIWWCYVGENVGIEMNGKGEKFTRPIFIFKKYDRYSFLGLPLTSRIKTGTWYVPINFGQKDQIVVLSQGRVFDYRRLKEKIGELEETESNKVRDGYNALHFLHKK